MGDSDDRRRDPPPDGPPERVPIERLETNPWWPRLEIDTGTLRPLIQAIERYGFVGHVEARRDPDDPDGKLQIVFGHRRVKAAQLAGLAAIPVQVVERSEAEMREMAFLENHTQQKLSYWDEGVFFARMRDEAGYSVRGMAELLGLSRGYVQNRLDVLQLPEGSALREAARASAIDMTTALTLLNLSRVMGPDEIAELVANAEKGEFTAVHLRRIREARAMPPEHAPGTGIGGERIWTVAGDPRGQPSAAEPAEEPGAGDDHAAPGPGPLEGTGANPVAPEPADAVPKRPRAASDPAGCSPPNDDTRADRAIGLLGTAVSGLERHIGAVVWDDVPAQKRELLRNLRRRIDAALGGA